MRIEYASEQGQGAANEDRVAAGMDWAFVLDGATAAPGVDSGCRHGVGWLVDRLASALAAELGAERRAPLTDVLAAAIERTRAAHGGDCDLENPDSPSSTVALVRRGEADTRSGGFSPTDVRLEYLVLADSAVIFETEDGGVAAVSDDRLDHLPGGRPYTRELVRASRNARGGFWVAGARVEAASEAVTGTVATAGGRFALMTDGCTRLVEYYGHSWEQVWLCLRKEGPHALISWVRNEERRHGVPRGKRHDDATALVGGFGAPRARPG
ncbi:protein phosphatase 2C domain-containing protein [Nocardiopsis rhodophaea]|uniref:protein phosphatase 2C domain-containing protein n=1 Tax=Nocardiopsis rhodophaea TaxID=280238 RepID=UPI0031E17ADC